MIRQRRAKPQRQYGLILLFLIGGCCASAPTTEEPRAAAGEVRAVLTAFHAAAAHADFDGYFELLHEDGVFLGTDASERWPRREFMEFARPYFQGESAWVFEPTVQHVTLAADGSFAWFEEDLHSASYGLCRGTGVMLRTPGGWRIGQYNLTVPVPNALLEEVVARIREEDASAP